VQRLEIGLNTQSYDIGGDVLEDGRNTLGSGQRRT